MDNLERAQRDWETPPDEEEAEDCEYCGNKLVMGKSNTPFNSLECDNPFCPEKIQLHNHPQWVLDMAEHLVEVEQELKDTQSELYYTSARLVNVKLLYDRLTQSQSNVVVRDTEYQIRRMEDAIDCLGENHNTDQELLSVVWQEWSEIKKILTQL